MKREVKAAAEEKRQAQLQKDKELNEKISISLNLLILHS